MTHEESVSGALGLMCSAMVNTSGSGFNVCSAGEHMLLYIINVCNGGASTGL